MAGQSDLAGHCLDAHDAECPNVATRQHPNSSRFFFGMPHFEKCRFFLRQFFLKAGVDWWPVFSMAPVISFRGGSMRFWPCAKDGNRAGVATRAPGYAATIFCTADATCGLPVRVRWPCVANSAAILRYDKPRASSALASATVSGRASA